MKLRQKLLLIPSVVILLMVISGIYAVMAMEKMGKSVTNIYEVQFHNYQLSAAVLDSARAANIGVYRLFTWLNNYNDKEIKEASTAIEKSIDEASKKANQLITEGNISSDENEDLSAVVKSLAAYKKEILKAIDLAQVDPNMGLSAMLEADKIYLKLQSQIQSIVKTTDLAASEEHKNSQTTSSHALTGFIVLLILAIAVGVAISLWMGGKIIGSLNQTIQFAKRVASGNLTGTIQVEGTDELAELEKALLEMQNNLHGIVSSIKGATNTMQTMAQNINESSKTVLFGTAEQHKAATTMAAAIEEMSMNINGINTHAKAADQAMHDSNHLATEGRSALLAVKESMQRIEKSSLDTRAVVESLGRESEQISNIINVIKSIADQTNLLALNAAIEAARAGEQGRGFAVVADEVRSLAARTAESTLEITSMISAIQSGVSGAVSGMQSGVSLVNEGGGLAVTAEAAMEQSVSKISEVTGMVNEMSSALREQRTASEMIAKEVHHIAEMGAHNSRATLNTTVAIERLNELSSELQETVSHFTV